MCDPVQAYKAGGHLYGEFVPLVLSLSSLDDARDERYELAVEVPTSFIRLNWVAHVATLVRKVYCPHRPGPPRLRLRGVRASRVMNRAEFSPPPDVISFRLPVRAS